jgi:putative NIF3 family GTP cyclohydrolase 1 type 2
MACHDISRRSLLAAGPALATAVAAPQAATLTAAQVIDRIKANVGVPWRAQTVDNVIAGNPETPVNGIATTMMATLDVIQRASKAGRNLVITHEPTFYSHQDRIEPLAEDPTYQFKLEFIRENKVVVFHFHDHWHAHKPDGIHTGMVRELGWEKNVDPENPRVFVFPSVPLVKLAREIQSRLRIRIMRVIGDPDLPINRATASWGYSNGVMPIRMLARADVDALIVGESPEWEVVEYAQDAIAAGKKKALIVLGHVVSEQSGMKYCAEWLKSFITEVPVDFVPAREPFWTPEKPMAVA